MEHYFVPPRHEAVRYFDQRVRVALGWEGCEEEDGLLFGLRGCHDDDGGVCFCSSVLGKCLSICVGWENVQVSEGIGGHKIIERASVTREGCLVSLSRLTEQTSG